MARKLPLFPKGMNKRWWLFRPIDLMTFLFRSRKPKQGLLVVRMDGLGDMILFRQVLDHYPEAFSVDKKDITILGCHSWRSLAGTIFSGFNVITINEHAYESQFRYRLKISLWLSRQRFKTATCDIYFRKTMACDSLLYYSYADRIVVCEPNPSKKTKPRFDYYRHLYTDVIDTGPHPLHEATRHYHFISHLLGRQMTPQPLSIPWRSQNSPITQRPYVVFNVGSNEPGRRWPFERFIEIAKRIIERDYTVVFIGGPSEVIFSDRLEKMLKHTQVINYIGKTKNLSAVLDIFKHAHATITSETGPGYFSLALQTPTVMICGGGAHTFFTPLPKGIRTQQMRFVYQYRECFECMERCPYRHDSNAPFPCLADVTIDHVWQHCEDLVPLQVPA